MRPYAHKIGISQFDDVPQETYQNARQGSPGQFGDVIHFYRIDGAEGIPLSELRGDTEALSHQLLNGHLPALPDNVSAKVSVRIQVSVPLYTYVALWLTRVSQFKGCKPYTRQIMARRATSNAEPISLATLAQKIGHEVQGAMVSLRTLIPFCAILMTYCTHRIRTVRDTRVK